MSSRVLLTVMPSLAVSLAFFLAPVTVAGKQPYLEEGRLAFGVHDLAGNPVQAGDERFRGKVVLLDLFGTWCAPCLTEIPTFMDLQERYGDRGLLIVGIAFEREDDAEARRRALGEFAEQYGINYLVLDGGPVGDFGQAFPTIRDVRGFPIEIVVDAAGRVVDVRNGSGYRKRWARRLEQELVELLGVD